MMDLLTTAEVAAILRVHRTTVQRLIEAKRLHALSVSVTGKRKQWRIPRESLQKMLETPQLLEMVRPAKRPQLIAQPFTHLKRYDN